MILFWHYFNKLLDCSRLRARIKAKYFEEVMGARKNGSREGDTLIQHKTKSLVKLMHQTILAAPSPHPPATAGVEHWQIFALPGVGHFPTPWRPPSSWHKRGFLSEYNYKEDFTGKSSRLANLSIACVASDVHSTILQQLRRQISLDYYSVVNLTRLYYNGSAAKSHSTTTKYRQLRRLICQGWEKNSKGL